jgi:predicted RND superfamily exporter protein
MAVVVVFGLMVATFLTLLVVPTLYLFLDDLPGRRKNAMARVRQLAGRCMVTLDSSAKS